MTLECRGGILADEMGMGKSLTLLSLLLHTTEEARIFMSIGREESSSGLGNLEPSRATLIIAPKSSMFAHLCSAVLALTVVI